MKTQSISGVTKKMSNISKIQETGNSLIEQVKQAYRENPGQTLAIGAGVVILAPTIFPLLKPVAKAAIRSSVSLFEKTQEAIAETGEAIGDIVAEAKAEAAAERAKKASLAAGLMAAPTINQDHQDN